MFTLILIVFILSVIYLGYTFKRPDKFPPGPSWLPFVGNLPEFKKLSMSLRGQHFAFGELARRYKTNVLGLKLGSDYVVTVFSYPVVRKVLTSEDYDSRPDNFFMRLRCMGTKKGITCTEGEFWKVQRSFLVKHLRNLGFGKTLMEQMIQDELVEISNIINTSNKELQIARVLAPSVINILWAFTAGERIPRDDGRLDKLLELFSVRTKVFDMSGGMLSRYPFLRFIAPEKTGYNVMVRINEQLKHFFMISINEHRKNWTEGREDDFIYAFITEQKKNEFDPETTFTDDQLVMVCMDIFIAGSTNTSSTIDFTILMMILYPEVQKKVQLELDTVFAKELPEYSKRHLVPYTEAVLYEVERYCNIAPVSGPRRVTKDTELEGYIIPKDTTVLLSLYSVHNDKEIWGDPEVFRPERFLVDGKVQVNEHLIQFGLGRRRCMGDALAKSCIFTFFAGILQKFVVSTKPGSPKPSEIPKPGLTLSPQNYTASFTKRQTNNNL